MGFASTHFFVLDRFTFVAYFGAAEGMLPNGKLMFAIK